MRTYQIIIAVIITLFASFSFEANAQNNGANVTMINSLLSISATVAKDTTGSENSSTPLVLQSTLTCPKCTHQQTEEMDTKSSQYFYKCGKCEEMVKTEKGQCCVFCSFANVPCPSKQEYNNKGGE